MRWPGPPVIAAEPLERHEEMGPALPGDQRVDLVDDDRLDRGEAVARGPT
jgi:hypothetical protein